MIQYPTFLKSTITRCSSNDNNIISITILNKIPIWLYHLIYKLINSINFLFIKFQDSSSEMAKEASSFESASEMKSSKSATQASSSEVKVKNSKERLEQGTQGWTSYFKEKSTLHLCTITYLYLYAISSSKANKFKNC